LFVEDRQALEQVVDLIQADGDIDFVSGLHVARMRELRESGT